MYSILTMLSCLWFAARVQLIHTFRDLPDDASPFVAFGPRGEALVVNRRHLSLYRLEDTEYRRTAERDRGGHFKAVTDRNIYVQNDTNDPTYQLNASDPSTITTLHHEGMLRGCVHPRSLVYAVQRSGYDDCIIHVHEETGVVILQPPEPRTWYSLLSACKAGPFIIVTECIKQSLDVFTLSGNIHHFASHAHDCY